MRKFFVLQIAGVLVGCAPAAPAAKSPDQLYCTQFGPITIRMDDEKANGIFSIRQNGDMGVIVGPLTGTQWNARWYEIDSEGDLEFSFTPDMSRFEGRYRLDREPDKWYEGWVGVLRPPSNPEEFSDGELTLYCM